MVNVKKSDEIVNIPGPTHLADFSIALFEMPRDIRSTESWKQALKGGCVLRKHDRGTLIQLRDTWQPYSPRYPKAQQHREFPRHARATHGPNHSPNGMGTTDLLSRLIAYRPLAGGGSVLILVDWNSLSLLIDVWKRVPVQRNDSARQTHIVSGQWTKEHSINYDSIKYEKFKPVFSSAKCSPSVLLLLGRLPLRQTCSNCFFNSNEHKYIFGKLHSETMPEELSDIYGTSTTKGHSASHESDSGIKPLPGRSGGRENCATLMNECVYSQMPSSLHPARWWLMETDFNVVIDQFQRAALFYSKSGSALLLNPKCLDFHLPVLISVEPNTLSLFIELRKRVPVHSKDCACWIREKWEARMKYCLLLQIIKDQTLSSFIPTSHGFPFW